MVKDCVLIHNDNHFHAMEVLCSNYN